MRVAVATIAAAILCTGVPSPVAHADGLSDATARLARLQDEASVVGEQYVQAVADLQAATDRANLLARDAAAQNGKVAALSSEVSQAAIAQFQERAVDPTVQIFTAPDANKFLNGLSTADQVATNQARLTTEYELQAAALADDLHEQDAAVLMAKTDAATAAGLKKDVDAKVAAADLLVQQLTAAELAKVNAGAMTSYNLDNLDLGDVQARTATAVKYAVSQAGKRYVWATSGPDTFDCSGLMLAAYRQSGIGLPHSSRILSTMGREVSRAELKPGDMLFWYSPVHHVGMYIGNGMFVHARNPQVGVVVQSVASYPITPSHMRRLLG